MFLLDKLNSNASQTYSLVDEYGKVITLSLQYLPAVQQWMYSIIWGTKNIHGNLLVCSPNILRAHKNVISFGIAVTSTDMMPPLYIDDFTTGRIKVYLLNSSDLSAIEANYYA
jgi:hypothetical protein